MSRKTRERSMEAEERWPRLYQFLACHLHEDWPEDHGTPEAAIDAAVAQYPTELRQQVAREWWDWNATAGATDDNRSWLEALGVAVWFESPLAARQFMNGVYDKLIVAIRAEHPRWRPDR